MRRDAQIHRQSRYPNEEADIEYRTACTFLGFVKNSGTHFTALRAMNENSRQGRNLPPCKKIGGGEMHGYGRNPALLPPQFGESSTKTVSQRTPLRGHLNTRFRAQAERN